MEESAGAAILERILALPLSKRVKALLAVCGISQVELARKYQLQRSEVCRVIYGERKSGHIRAAIAQEVNLPVEVIFADPPARPSAAE